MKLSLRKALALLLCFCLCMGLFPLSVASADANDEESALAQSATELFDAAKGVLVNAANFPDPFFRAYIEKNCDTDGDLVLTDEEIAAVTEMDVHDLGISDLSGIWEFSHLVTLNCSENSLRELDVSDLPYLERLYCQDNLITETAPDDPDGADPTDSGLAYLLPSSALKVLWCYNNNLTAENLNLSICSDLEYLDCSNNPLGTLDLSPVPKLLELRCNNAGLRELDLSHTPELCVLWCWSDYVRLFGYYTVRYPNGIQRLDLSVCPKLVKAVVYGSRENYTFNSAFFDGESEVSVSSIDGVTLYLGDNYDEFVVEQTTPEGSVVAAIDAEHFPDPAFLSAVSQFDQNGDGYLSERDISLATYMSLSDNEISSLEGIGIFTALDSLYIENTQVTALDLSQNRALTSLSCGNNQLSTLNVTKNTALSSLGCEGNQLETLNLTKNTALVTLDCQNNRLSALNLSKNTRLSSLHCEGNRLTALNLSNNTALGSLYCQNNLLSALDLSHNPELAVINCQNNPLASLNLGSNPVLLSMDCSVSDIGVLDIGDCPRLVKAVENGTNSVQDGVTLYQWADLGLVNAMQSFDSVASLTADSATVFLTSESIDIDEVNFPDPAFRGFVTAEIDTDANGRLSGMERYMVTAMDCSGKGIQSLKGLEHFQRLGNLNCSGNALSTLDLRLCPVLRTVASQGAKSTSGTSVTYTYGNNTLTLDADVRIMVYAEGVAVDAANFPDANFRSYISRHLDLDGDNQLSKVEIRAVTELDVSEQNISDLTGINYFTELTTLNCSWNKLSSLNVSGLSKLVNLYCQNNYIYGSASYVAAGVDSALPREASDDLAASNAESFYAPISDGGIGNLIIGSAPLKLLWCYDNQLTSLNLSGCSTLENLDCAFNWLGMLDVSNLRKLKVLMCHDNNLTSLNVRSNSALTYLWCWNNMIEELDISQCPTLVAAVANGSIENFNDHVSLFNDTAEVSISQYTALFRGGAIDAGVPISAATFPDNNFRAFVRVSVDSNYDGVLSAAEIEAAEYLNCTGWQIASLEGINYLTGLRIFNCRSNLLTELDVSGLYYLEDLDCSYNRISFLNVSGNAALKRLRAVDNLLDSNLDLSANSALLVLWCWGNNIETLDLTGCPILSMLALNGIVERYEGGYTGYYDDEGNYIEVPLPGHICRFDKSGISDLSTDENVTFKAELFVELNSANFPDPNFLLCVKDLAGGGETLSQAQLSAIREINCAGMGIASLKGIEFFTALEKLNCSGNSLKALDLSALTALTELNCSGNRLKTLDTSRNPALLLLNCSNNRLTSVIFSNNYLLENLDCSHNSLTQINLVDCDTISGLINGGAQASVTSGVRTYSGSYRRDGQKVQVSFSCDVGALLFTLVSQVPDLIVPAELTTIGDEAFRGGMFTCVMLLEKTASIGSNAFANCPNLRYVYILNKDAEINPNAFGNLQGLTIYGRKGSTAAVFAQQKGYAFVQIG